MLLLLFLFKSILTENVAERQFRAIWIATVSNIDWPSNRGLPEATVKSELLAQFDLAQEMNQNVIMLQVRPAADAFYQSELEPWSYWLTGQNGKNPGWDPLEFAIEESHRRSLELHVWLNPYRAKTPSSPSTLSPLSPANVYAEYTYKLSAGYWWMDPGASKIQAHMKSVIRDLVTRYDIDGLHYDDYFYPYASYNNGADFPDSATYNEYRNNGGTMSKSDWRRDNVNQMVESTYDIIKELKPWVTFGVAPFGIWRPGNPPGIVGMDAYEALYCDSKKWINEGWLDYIAPQLYWPIDSTGQPFEPLFDWWLEQNHKNHHVMPGLYASGVMPNVKDWPAQEIADQIKIIRTKNPSTAVGEIHFSMQAFQKNTKGLTDLLESDTYATVANVPELTWISAPDMPVKPTFTQSGNDISFTNLDKDVRLVAIYANNYLIARHGDLSKPWTIPEEYRTSSLCMKIIDKYRQHSHCSVICGFGQIENDIGQCWDEICPSIENKRACLQGGDPFVCHSVGCNWCPHGDPDLKCIYD